MNGKVNIVFGFIYLAMTALLGPVLLVPQLGANLKTMGDTAQVVDKVQEGLRNDFKGFKGANSPNKVIGQATVSIFNFTKNSKNLSLLAGGPHAHGNLEALLNIAAGVVLLTLAIPANFKKLLSILFLIGAVFHSGMLYLGGVFGLMWAYNFTIIGVIALLAGLVFAGIASIIGIKDMKQSAG